MKEFFALVLLIVIITGAIWNIHHLGGAIDEILEYIDRAEELAIQGNFEESSKNAEDAAEYWQKLSPYASILLRHPEIDACTGAFYEMRVEIGGENYKRAKGTFDKARKQLNGIIEMERLSFGSVF